MYVPELLFMWSEADWSGRGRFVTDYSLVVSTASKAAYSIFCLLLPLQHFDTDHSGYITERKELEAALKEHCPTKAMLAKQIKSIMLEVDTNHDGVIDFQEFCHMMCASAVGRR